MRRCRLKSGNKGCFIIMKDTSYSLLDVTLNKCSEPNDSEKRYTVLNSFVSKNIEV